MAGIINALNDKKTVFLDVYRSVCEVIREQGKKEKNETVGCLST